RSAICRLVSPSASNAATSHSRELSSAAGFGREADASVAASASSNALSIELCGPPPTPAWSPHRQGVVVAGRATRRAGRVASGAAALPWLDAYRLRLQLEGRRARAPCARQPKRRCSPGTPTCLLDRPCPR